MCRILHPHTVHRTLTKTDHMLDVTASLRVFFYNHHAIKLEFSNKHVSIKPVQCLEIKKRSNRDQEKIEQILI